MYDNISLTSEDNIIFLSTQFEDLRPSIESHCLSHNIKRHVFFLSSGTTSISPKGYLISKKAMFTNANAVNTHLSLNSEDRWGLTLPPFHVGGISMFFRSALLNQRLPANLLPWSPNELPTLIKEQGVSVISLVPSQIYDLVRLKKTCPETLKYVLAGGDFLSEALEQQALDLGWPIIRTFGMSELGSQLATGTLEKKNKLQVLSIHQVKVDELDRILVKSPSLFSYVLKYIETWEMQSAESLFDPEGYYPLPDRAKLSGAYLIPLGRDDGRIKISGRLLDFFHLKNLLEEFCLKRNILRKMELYVKSDLRSGHKLCLLIEESVEYRHAEEFQLLIQPWRIQLIKKVPCIERTLLGKLKTSAQREGPE